MNGAYHKTPSPKLLIFSAADEDGIKRMTNKYVDYWSRLHLGGINLEYTYLANLAFTLASRRSILAWRSFSVAQSFSDLSEIETSNAKPIRPTRLPRLSFIFTGQGSQWAGMGKELLSDYPSFQDDIRAMDKTLAHCPHPPSWTIEGKYATYGTQNLC